jgi:hypothetical protein
LCGTSRCQDIVDLAQPDETDEPIAADDGEDFDVAL